ncbi:MAG: hypothetical protein FD183_923, partial [Chitinophagaceae bacterium]
MKRRSFLRNLGFTGGVFAFPSVLTNAHATTVETDDQLVIKGKVLSKGKGIAGVVVSDGIQVFKTDKNGQYQFTVKENTDFVFISSPAGYTFNHTVYIAS